MTQLRPRFAALTLTAILAGGAVAQTADDLRNDHATPGDVLVYGMGYAGIVSPVMVRTGSVRARHST